MNSLRRAPLALFAMGALALTLRFAGGCTGAPRLPLHPDAREDSMREYGSAPYIQVGTAANRPATPARAGTFYLESDTGNLFVGSLSGTALLWQFVIAGLNTGAGVSTVLSARLASTANVDEGTGGLLVIDGVQTVAGDVVLLKNQTSLPENGLWVVAAGAWTRATTMDAAAEFLSRRLVAVGSGSTNGGTVWGLAVPDAFTLGVSDVNFVRAVGSSSYIGSATIGGGGTVTVSAPINGNSNIQVTPRAANVAGVTTRTTGADTFVITGTAADVVDWLVNSP